MTLLKTLQRPQQKTLARAALATTALLLTGCGDLLFAEVEIPEVCSRLPAQTVPSGPDIVGTVSPRLRLSVDVTDALPEDADLLEADVRLKRAIFRSTDGRDLGFLEALDMGVASSAEGAPAAAALVDWTRETEPTSATELDLTGNTGVNLYPYTSAGRLALDLGMTVRPPAQETTLEPVLCFGLTGKLNYGDAL